MVLFLRFVEARSEAAAGAADAAALEAGLEPALAFELACARVPLEAEAEAEAEVLARGIISVLPLRSRLTAPVSAAKMASLLPLLFSPLLWMTEDRRGDSRPREDAEPPPNSADRLRDSERASEEDEELFEFEAFEELEDDAQSCCWEWAPIATLFLRSRRHPLPSASASPAPCAPSALALAHVSSGGGLW